MHIRLASFLAIALFAAHATAAPAPAIDRVEPPFWWAGMHERQLQLMVHGPAIADLEPTLDYPGVRIERVTRVANRNYVFVDLTIAPNARPGSFTLAFNGDGANKGDADTAGPTYIYRLLPRSPGSAERQGFSSRDAIYALMPDRFANGDPRNDDVAGMGDKADRNAPDGRHGGDIQGIVDHLDYIAGLGFTQLWPMPLVENDMPAFSYHGYAATDHYRIDARFGTNEDYVRLAQEARRRGIGLIQDVVLSHIGSGHWWLKDMPTPDWLNYGGRFVPTMHHRTAVQDPYAARADADNFTMGWFGPHMPDLNQANPLVATYLIQNHLWWIEYAGLSGLRIDTIGYSDGAFLSAYTKRLMTEYPHLNMVGEEWSKLPGVVAHWQRGKRNPDGYATALPGLMDFPLSEAMRTALAPRSPGSEGADNVFNEVYETLSQDQLYPDPGNLVLFEANHDIVRLFSAVGEDVARWKMDIAFVMTMPRIPQFYSGDEILMPSTAGRRDDASYRRDFPGGWRGDRVDAFTGAGLSSSQRDAQAFVRKLVNWRKASPVIHHGKLMHYGPEGNTYVYFRYDGTRKVMVALNANPNAKTLATARFHEMLDGVSSGTDVITGATFDLARDITLPAKSALILELR
jgi:glycosidase